MSRFPLRASSLREEEELADWRPGSDSSSMLSTFSMTFHSSERSCLALNRDISDTSRSIVSLPTRVEDWRSQLEHVSAPSFSALLTHWQFTVGHGSASSHVRKNLAF